MTLKFDDSGPSKYGWHSGDDAMFRCEQEFVFKHLRRIAKAGQLETPRAKAIGLLVHAGRARWFRLGFPLPNDIVFLRTAKQNVTAWDSIYQAVQEEAERQPLPMPPGAEQEALNILQQYVAHYSQLPKPKVVAAELELGPLTIAEGSQELHTIRLDDLSEYPDFANALGSGECKTTSGKPSAVYAHYDANHGQLLKQMLVITEAIKQGKLKVAKDPIGVILDVIQKGYGGEKCKFERFLVTVEAYQLEWFARDLERVRRRRRELERLEAEARGSKHRWVPNSEQGMECRKCGEHMGCEVHDLPHSALTASRNPTACRRLVSGDGGQFIAVPCEYLNLCKYGRSAATEYTVNGQPAGAVKGAWWR